MDLHAITALYRDGRLADAESAVARYAQANPTDGAGLQLAAMIAARRGDAPAALARIDAALSCGGGKAERHVVRGNILRRLGRDVDAEAAYADALQEQPDHVDALNNLSRLQLDTAQPRAAARGFQALLSHRPGHAPYRDALIEAQLRGGEWEAADATLSAGGLPDAAVRLHRARLALLRGDADAALSLCTDPGGTDPARLSLELQLLRMTGQWDAARDRIADTLARQADDPALWAVAVRALRQAGELSSARAALAHAPEGPDTDLVRAEVLNASGDYGAARDAATRGLTRAPGTPALMRALAEAALGAGDAPTAQAVATLGLQAVPHDQFFYAVRATAGRALGQDYGHYFNYSRFVRVFDLDPPEGWADMAAFNADLRNALGALHGLRAAPLDQSLRGGTQTAPDLRFAPDPAIQAFFRAIDPAVRAFLSDVPHDPDHPFLGRQRGGYRVASAWSVRLGAGGRHVSHVHPEGWISSAYYVDAPAGEGRDGWIAFGAPPEPLASALRQTPELEVEPRAGRLVLFPSYLWHGTYPAPQGDSPRLTLPFDVLPAADMPY